jgi:hypothetical protein
VVLAINDAACPAFGTFFSATPPYNIVGAVSLPQANNAAEQPIWDPAQKLFLIAMPSTTKYPTGEIYKVDPLQHVIVGELPTPNCGPQGEVLGQGETLFLGCSSTTQLLTINAATGATISSIPNAGGADEVNYNPATNHFFAASGNAVPSALLVIADGNGNLIQEITTSTGAHSVAVDSSDHVYLPQRGPGLTLFFH